MAWVASGRPRRVRAASAEIAKVSARGSATPMSSLAKMISRRIMKRGSSPASSIRIIQYTLASGSLPRIDLMNALTTL